MSFKILLTGGSGFVGSNIAEELREKKLDFISVNSKDYNLLNRVEADAMFNDIKPSHVIHCAALSGGIMANKEFPANFCYENLSINTNVFDSAYRNGVNRFLTFIGGCSYPAKAANPIAEEFMWEGFPQAESAPYSVAKKMMLVMSDAYRRQYGFNSLVVIPGNLYGPYDNYNLKASHVIPALIRKFHEAKVSNKESIEAWGSGKPVRDFLYVKDLARIVPDLLFRDEIQDFFNISSGLPVSIYDLLNTIKEIIDFKGEIIWDQSKPDGQMEKLFSVERLNNHFPNFKVTCLLDGLSETYKWFRENQNIVRL